MIQLQPSYNSTFSADLMSEIKQNRKKYNQLSQISYYASLESIEQLGIFTKSSCDVQCNVVFCYNSEKYDSKIRREISYYILRTLNDQIPKLKNKYSLAYVHENISGFLYFRNIIRLMPADFMARLKDFYIVHSGLGLRIVQLFSFGEINSYLKSKAIYIQRIDEIQTNNKITLGGDAVLKSKMRLAQERQSFRNNVRLTKEMQSSDVNIIRNKLYGKQVSQYELSAHGIPIFIETLIITLYSKMDFLRAEGIMRKSCDVQQLEVLETHLMEDQNWPKYVASCDDPYVLCGCVKKIFNNLNTPLFSYQVYDLIVSYRSDGHIQNDITFMRSCISKMGKINRMLMLYIIAFLKKGIITYVQDNKMSAYNLAVVFGPCFFRPKQYRLEDLMSSGRFSFMIKLLLENYQKTVTQEIAISMYNLLQKQKDSLV